MKRITLNRNGQETPRDVEFESIRRVFETKEVPA